MNFIKLPISDETGSTKNIPVNLDLVVTVLDIPISTGMVSTDGTTPLVKTGTGLMMSNSVVLPCLLERKEVEALLGLENDKKITT